MRAKSAGKGALTGFITRLVLSVLITVISILSIGSLSTGLLGIITDTSDKGIPAIIDGITENITQKTLENSLDVSFGNFTIKQGSYSPTTKLYVTLKKKSDIRRSFSVTIEAVDENGARIGTATVYASSLNSGQEIKLETFEYIPEDKISLYKKASFKVLDASSY